MKIELIELESKQSMLEHLNIIQELYEDMTFEKYQTYLDQMLGFNYGQVLVLLNGEAAAISGYWCGTKLWCGAYMELDNVIVKGIFRGKGIGKHIQNYLEKKAIKKKCNIMVLDAYTSNFGAHKFYYNEGYVAKGFHFIKTL